MTFKMRVRERVKAIPKGETMTYGEVAKAVGNPGAARAVGTIMRTNYDPEIPCHRVICADGSLGNYNRGGAAEKQRLLRAEGVAV